MSQAFAGITFAELHSKSAAELAELQAEHSMTLIRGTIDNSSLGFSEDEKALLLERTRAKITEIYKGLCDEEYFGALRKLYDTEEKFALVLTFSARLEQAAPQIRRAMEELVEDMLD